MKINARIDDELLEKIEFLKAETHQTTSEIIKTSVDQYYQSVKSKRKTSYLIAQESGFISSFAAEPDLSVNYKKHVADVVGKKHDHR